MKAKRTYFTKKDLFSFHQHMISDERKQRLMNETQAKLEQGIKNPTPLTVLLREITDEDFKEWKEKFQNK